MGVDERFKAKKRERNQILKQKSQRKKNKKGVRKKKLINTTCESNISIVAEEHVLSEINR